MNMQKLPGARGANHLQSERAGHLGIRGLMAGRTPALPPEAWGEVAVRLPHPYQSPRISLRLVCRAARAGADGRETEVLLSDRCRWWPETGEDLTGPEMLRLLRKLPALQRVDLHWTTSAGFLTAAEAVAQAAQEKGTPCHVWNASISFTWPWTRKLCHTTGDGATLQQFLADVRRCGRCGGIGAEVRLTGAAPRR